MASSVPPQLPSRASRDDRAQAAARDQFGDSEAAAHVLRAQLRSGELARAVLALRAHSGDTLAQLALAEPAPPKALGAWVEALASVDQRAWICAPLVAAGLCVSRLSGWAAGEGTGRVLGNALIEVARTVLDGRDESAPGRLDPRRSAERALAAASLEMDELRQLMESIQAEHALLALRAPRALSCGLAAVETIATSLRASRGVRALVATAVVECAIALGDEVELRAALEAAALAAADRLVRHTHAARQSKASRTQALTKLIGEATPD